MAIIPTIEVIGTDGEPMTINAADFEEYEAKGFKRAPEKRTVPMEIEVQAPTGEYLVVSGAEAKEYVARGFKATPIEATGENSVEMIGPRGNKVFVAPADVNGYLVRGYTKPGEGSPIPRGQQIAVRSPQGVQSMISEADWADHQRRGFTRVQ